MTESALRLVNANGEVVGDLQHADDCVNCATLRDERDGLERDLRSWRARYADLRRDREGNAKRSELWPAAVRVFETWRRVCAHPKSKWSLDRFELLEPFLKSHGEDRCLQAVGGAAWDAFETQRKNGTTKRHDDLTLVFRSADKLEEFAARAPAFWRLLVAGLDARRVPDGYVDVSGDTARIWCPGPLGSRPCFASVPILEHEMRACRCGRVYQFERGELWAARR